MRIQASLMAALTALVALSGCLSDDVPDDLGADPTDEAPFLGYLPDAPDLDIPLIEEDLFLEAFEGVTIHARVMRPDTDEPVPVIAQFTPYTAPGKNVALDQLLEPQVGCVGTGPASVGCEATFDREFVRRGYAFAYGDVRGTGDSSGCLDLRGKLDIADLGHFADTLAAQPWSNGNVGFIGASYPGSEAHMAAMSGSEAVKAVIPIVASTSFYHYHHNDGVPYSGQHSLGGTNTGYTSNAVSPTLSPQSPNYLTRIIEEAQCPTAENVLDHGGMDQTGAYYDWWQERNLRAGAADVTTPVLMAQGLADWNVKPDHVATWFNDLASPSKTFIGGQWGHAYPASDDGACRGPLADGACEVPWDDWWAYAAAFFDTFLKEVDTGMFQGSTAWVQDNAGTWHRSGSFPLAGDEADGITLRLADMKASGGVDGAGWYACPNDTVSKGTAAGVAEDQTAECRDHPGQSLVFETAPFERDVHLSGVPLVNLTVDTDGRTTHLTVVMEVVGGGQGVRENYGYLNPLYRHGLEHPEAMPDGAERVTIDLYPQEDVVKKGQKLRFILASDDGGRTIEAYEEGTVTLDMDGENTVWLPVRPAGLLGVRLG